jgi:hypothetical protein
MLKKLLLSVAFPLTAFSQGAISDVLPKSEPCGSFHLMEHLDQKMPGFMAKQNQLLTNIPSTYAAKMASQEIVEIPVVFHLVSYDTNDFLPDSVIENQLNILNEAFRRLNADTVNLRPEFDGFGADTRIEFYLATEDPNGNPTNGITKTTTSVEYFGGLLPFGPSQQAQIQQWVADSLLYNFFRVTHTNRGGIDPWNTQKYLNIWVSDMRIDEPQFNNIKELVYLGLATPPDTHPNWPDSIYGNAPVNDGILMHRSTIGSNNTIPYEAPFGVFNTLANEGISLVHEVGHYLGLRHVWGDGGCSEDDYVNDTPRMSNSSQYDCNTNKNTCVDTINGSDLPDMVENYMDYSSDACKNTFTNEQVNIMRNVIDQYRSDFLSSTPTHLIAETFTVFPNPTQGNVTVVFSNSTDQKSIHIYTIDGQLVNTFTTTSGQTSFHLPMAKGMYLISATTNQKTSVVRVLNR